jgi:hypothetical protein
MRIRVLSAPAIAALLLSAGPALAFQEEAAAPVPEAAGVAPEATQPTQDGAAPNLQLQAPPSAAPESSEKKGAKIFGFNLLPKLDFGLELLYSNQPSEIQQLPQTQLEEQNDLTVLGKVKRHF